MHCDERKQTEYSLYDCRERYVSLLLVVFVLHVYMCMLLLTTDTLLFRDMRDEANYE
jgi:hypothetical protein